MLVTSDHVSEPNYPADDRSAAPADRPLTEREKVAARREEAEQAQASRRTYPWWVEFPIILVIALLLLALFNSFVGRPYLIPSESMEPTLHGCEDCEGRRIFVNKLSYSFGGEPEPGDVVVFIGPESWNDQYVSQRSDNSVLRGLQTGLSLYRHPRTGRERTGEAGHRHPAVRRCSARPVTLG